MNDALIENGMVMPGSYCRDYTNYRATCDEVCDDMNLDGYEEYDEEEEREE